MNYAITRLFLRSDLLESSQADTKENLQTIYILTLAHTLWQETKNIPILTISFGQWFFSSNICCFWWNLGSYENST